MKTHSLTALAAILTAGVSFAPAQAETIDVGITDIVTVKYNAGGGSIDANFHPKNVPAGAGSKSAADRFALLRFDSASFGGDVISA